MENKKVKETSSSPDDKTPTTQTCDSMCKVNKYKDTSCENDNDESWGCTNCKSCSDSGGQYNMIYDENGNQIYGAWGCDWNTGQNCTGSQVYEYNEAGKRTMERYNCDPNGQNCAYSEVNEYNEAGQITMYKHCDGNGQNCTYSAVYEYNNAGQETIFKQNCDGNGIKCTMCNAYNGGSCVKNSHGYYDPEDTDYGD